MTSVRQTCLRLAASQGPGTVVSGAGSSLMVASLAPTASWSFSATPTGRARGCWWWTASRSHMLILTIRGTWNLSTCGGSGT
jgi:hypothetical protein